MLFLEVHECVHLTWALNRTETKKKKHFYLHCVLKTPLVLVIALVIDRHQINQFYSADCSEEEPRNLQNEKYRTPKTALELFLKKKVAHIAP